MRGRESGAPPGRREGERSSLRQVARNSGLLIVSKVGGIAASLVMIPLVARYLGVEKFGEYALITVVSMIVAPITDFGMERILCREISVSAEKADGYMSTAVFVKGMISLVVVAGSWLLSLVFSGSAEFRTALLLSNVSEVILSLGITYITAMRAFERMEYELITNLMQKGSALALTVAVILRDGGFLALFYAKLGSSLFFFLASAYFLYRRFVKPSLAFHADFAKFILAESLPLAVFGILITLIFRVDTFIINWFCGTGDVAMFEIPNRLITHMQIIPMSVTLSLFPLLSRAAQDPGNGSLQQYYNKSFVFFLVLGIPMSGVLYSTADPLIRILFGEAYLPAAGSLRILAPTILLLCLISLQNFVLTALGKQRSSIVSVALALVLNVALDVLLVPRYRYLGASIATLVAYAFLFGVNSYMVALENLKARFDASMRGALLAGLLMCAAGFIELRQPLLELVVRVGAGLGLYAAALFFLGVITREEIGMLRGAPPGPEPAGKGRDSRGL